MRRPRAQSPELKEKASAEGGGVPKAYLVRIRCRGGYLAMRIGLSAAGLQVKGLYLSLRNDLRPVRISLPFTASRRGNETLLTCRVCLEDYALEPVYWDLAVGVANMEPSDNGRAGGAVLEGIASDGGRADGAVLEGTASDGGAAGMADGAFAAEERRPAKECLLPVKTSAGQRAFFTLGQCACRLRGGWIFFPYRKELAFIFRKETPYDGFGQRLREYGAAAVFALGRPVLQKKRIWLIYEKFCAQAQDNGWYFFKYCMDNLPENEKRRIFYVLAPASPDWDRTTPYQKQVLPFMSFRHMVYAMAARVYVASEAASHIYVWQARPNLITSLTRKKPLVFLQHGVTAFKQVHPFFGRDTLGPKSSFVTTSAFEQTIVTRYFGYTPENAPILGFCRWDALKNLAPWEEDRFILIMPTWRVWLEDGGPEAFRESDYYRRYASLLSNKRLATLMETYGFRLVFYLHPRLAGQLQHFKAKAGRVTLVPFGSRPLNDILMRCQMLVTDYSSVSWDVFYMAKPVLFYQFDLAAYTKAHGGGYINFETDLFGERFTKEAALVEGIGAYAADGFKEKSSYGEMRTRLFAYHDKSNGARTYDYLIKRGY